MFRFTMSGGSFVSMGFTFSGGIAGVRVQIQNRRMPNMYCQKVRMNRQVLFSA